MVTPATVLMVMAAATVTSVTSAMVTSGTPMVDTHLQRITRATPTRIMTSGPGSSSL